MTAEIDFPDWPSYAEDEIQAVESVLRSGQVNYWTGDTVRNFENEYAAYVGMPHAVALANGSVALELALRVFGITKGDDVIVTSRSFVASASCVALSGARPVFTDVDRNSQNITASTIEEVITPETKAIIVVHLAGWPCDMDEILSLAKSKNIKIIEDCAQAHGASYKGKPVGSFGDASVFSFCQDKIMSTGGEGGMLMLKERDSFETAWSYKDHGKSYELAHNIKYSSEFAWLHESFGTNLRMTAMQAAIGQVQLRKLDDWVRIRQKNAALLNEGFAEPEEIRLTLPADNLGHAYYKYYAFVNSEALPTKCRRSDLVKSLVDRGIPCSTGSCGEIYREGAFQAAGFHPKSRFSTAKELGETSMVFPVHPLLNSRHMETIIFELVEVIKKAKGC